jgi:NAD+ kinase
MSAARQPEKTRPVESAAVYTHFLPQETAQVLPRLIEEAERAGVELRFDAEETAKHGLENTRAPSVKPNANLDADAEADVCIVLGGDGTTLRSLRRYAGTEVPVFSINCGRIGFLATVDRDEAATGLARALSGDFDVMKMPALLLGEAPDREYALNEVSFQRGSHMNVAHLSYSLSDEKVARAQCDGLIASTPAGSTGYNLSAGGPILAWGVRGFVVSMVAPHALSARSLVAAPDDVLRVKNEGSEPVDVVIDGMRTGEIGPGEEREVRLRAEAVGLAQLPGTSFYRRFRDKLKLLTA